MGQVLEFDWESCSNLAEISQNTKPNFDLFDFSKYERKLYFVPCSFKDQIDKYDERNQTTGYLNVLSYEVISKCHRSFISNHEIIDVLYVHQPLFDGMDGFK